MQRAPFFAGAAFALALIIATCGTGNDGMPCAPSGTAGTTGSSAGGADAGDTGAADADAADPACETQPIALPDHPSAVLQASAMGKCLRNVRGFHGRVYFGYGDLNANTGPIDIASLDPKAKTWQHHLTLQTESIERFLTIGDELWAPCADAHGPEATGCEYASGDANHDWQVHDFAVSIHMMDGTERVPGEVLLGGSSFLDPAQTTTGAFLWRSVAGAPFQQIFPDNAGNIERAGGPFMSLATLNGVTYAVTFGSVWAWDGKTFSHARTPGAPDDPVLLSDFIHPVTFANHIVFGTFGGYLWKFDGKHTERLGIRTFDTPTSSGFTEAPIVILEESEGRLLTVNENGDVLMSQDLVTFRCIGKAPPDVRGLGSLDGVIYFGGANGHVYAYEKPSW